MNKVSVRIQLDLSSCTEEHPRRWMLVDQGATKSIKTLCAQLEGKFSKHKISLYIDDCWLPPEESTLILRNGDVVTVVQVPKNDVKHVSSSSDSESSADEPIQVSKKEGLSINRAILNSVEEETECNEPPRKKRKRRRKRKQKNKNKLQEDELSPTKDTSMDDSNQPSSQSAAKLSNTESRVVATHTKFPNDDEVDEVPVQNESTEKPEQVSDPMVFKPPDRKFGAQMIGVSCEEVLLHSVNRKSRKSLETCDASVESRNTPVNISSNESAYNGLKNLINLAKQRQPVRGERHSLDVTSCPDLNSSTIKEGDKVAFKVFELSENYEPGMSDYKSGTVTGIEGEFVSIQLDEDSRKERNGKFEMDNGDDSGILTINVTDMQCAKLISQK